MLYKSDTKLKVIIFIWHFGIKVEVQQGFTVDQSYSKKKTTLSHCGDCAILMSSANNSDKWETRRTYTEWIIPSRLRY